MKAFKTKKTIWLNGTDSCIMNDAKEGCTISRYSMLAYADNVWHLFTESTVLDYPICVMFNKKKAQACKGTEDKSIIQYDKVILLWKEGIEPSQSNQDEVDVMQLSWNGLMFFNNAKRKKVFKWRDTGFCGEELSKVVLFLVGMVFGEHALMQKDVLQTFQGTIASNTSDTLLIK